ncbi:MAG: NAD(P)-dependent oxidoreductase [Melioribacteraceae bacterium]|nr:NAD(P)-dependent oxidoreductase [Melioribacteraceae bacterium]
MKVGLIGTGLMGKPIARKIKDAGYELMVYNRTIQKAKDLEEDEIKVALSTKELVDFADVILVVLADYNAVTSMLFGDDVKYDGKTVVQMSTITPKESLLLKERVEKFGGNYFEAPVLGSIPQILDQKLIVLVGGTEKNKVDHEKLFSSFSSKIVFIGEVGKAAAIKLALNQLIASETSAFAMSLGYLREMDVDIDKFMDILKGSALYAPTFEKKLGNYMQRDFSNPNFPLKHLLKDVRLMIDQFGQSGINTKGLEAIAEIIKTGLDQKLSEKDYSSLYNVIHPAKK